jgi:hypothetical protein
MITGSIHSLGHRLAVGRVGCGTLVLRRRVGGMAPWQLTSVPGTS